LVAAEGLRLDPAKNKYSLPLLSGLTAE